jgi:hypothetical protein
MEGPWDNCAMRQLQLFTTAELAKMRDRTASRNYSAERDEFRREHERHRAWGLTQRHAAKLRRARETRPPGRIDDRRALAPRQPAPRRPTQAQPAQNPASAATRIARARAAAARASPTRIARGRVGRARADPGHVALGPRQLWSADPARVDWVRHASRTERCDLAQLRADRAGQPRPAGLRQARPGAVLERRRRSPPPDGAPPTAASVAAWPVGRFWPTDTLTRRRLAALRRPAHLVQQGQRSRTLARTRMFRAH